MPRHIVKGALERTAAADLWKNTLSRIPSVFGRLIYLAGLRDANSGSYRHHGLAAVFGRDESTRALRESHEKTFADWLCLSLEQKNNDLSVYFDGLEEPKEEIVDHFRRSRSYRAHVPDSARRVEQRLFRRDLEILLELRSNARK